MIENLCISKHLEEFLDCIAECKRVHPVAVENYELENKRQQDLLHGIEFETQPRELTELATRLHKSRQERRYWKDIIEEAEIMVKFFEEPGHKRTFEKLKQLLGSARKIEQYHENRSYKIRVKEE